MRPRFCSPAGKVLRGAAICCRGQKVACDFRRVHDPRPPASPLGDKIVHKCLIQHEQTHFADMPDCQKWPSLEFPPLPDYKSSECHALHQQALCLQVRMQECGDDKACKNFVHNELEEVKFRLTECAK